MKSIVEPTPQPNGPPNAAPSHAGTTITGVARPNVPTSTTPAARNPPPMAKPLEKRTEHPFGLPHALNKYPNAPVTAPLANLPPPATDASRAKRGIQQQAADREALPV